MTESGGVTNVYHTGTSLARQLSASTLLSERARNDSLTSYSQFKPLCLLVLGLNLYRCNREAFISLPFMLRLRLCPAGANSGASADTMAPSSKPYSQNILRVKPSRSPSGSLIPLHGIDHAAALLTPLNLFFKPSIGGPTQLHDFANSLRDVLDRLPLCAGSICTVQDAQGVKSLHLIEDGRGVDLIWEESTAACTHPLALVDITPRPITVHLDDPNQTLLMVKFTKVCFISIRVRDFMETIRPLTVCLWDPGYGSQHVAHVCRLHILY